MCNAKLLRQVISISLPEKTLKRTKKSRNEAGVDKPSHYIAKGSTKHGREDNCKRHCDWNCVPNARLNMNLIVLRLTYQSIDAASARLDITRSADRPDKLRVYNKPGSSSRSSRSIKWSLG